MFDHPVSGPTNREEYGSDARVDSLKLVGAALRDDSFASHRIEKHVVAARAKAVAKKTTLRLTTYAADATAWARFLRADTRSHSSSPARVRWSRYRISTKRPTVHLSVGPADGPRARSSATHSRFRNTCRMGSE